MQVPTCHSTHKNKISLWGLGQGFVSYLFTACHRKSGTSVSVIASYFHQLSNVAGQGILHIILSVPFTLIHAFQTETQSRCIFLQYVLIKSQVHVYFVMLSVTLKRYLLTKEEDLRHVCWFTLS